MSARSIDTVTQNFVHFQSPGTMDKIITNTNSWRWTQPLKESDVILPWPTPEGELPWPAIVQLGQCLGFFASVIKSGEPWTATCQSEYDLANKAIKQLYAEVCALARPAAEGERVTDHKWFDPVCQEQGCQSLILLAIIDEWVAALAPTQGKDEG